MANDESANVCVIIFGIFLNFMFCNLVKYVTLTPSIMVLNHLITNF